MIAGTTRLRIHHGAFKNAGGPIIDSEDIFELGKEYKVEYFFDSDRVIYLYIYSLNSGHFGCRWSRSFIKLFQ